jgi:hypothetical protein
MTREHGQATVEVTALLPLVVVIALSAYTVLAARSAHEQAGAAAEAGAVALLQDRDAREAARLALPAGATAKVAVRKGRVSVTVRPRLPLFAARLEARATADAGSP